MQLVFAGLIFVGAAAWTWGAVTGRLASMVAAAVNPNWVG